LDICFVSVQYPALCISVEFSGVVFVAARIDHSFRKEPLHSVAQRRKRAAQLPCSDSESEQFSLGGSGSVNGSQSALSRRKQGTLFVGSAGTTAGNRHPSDFSPPV
jgi:hypothetical protein